jgi:glyoxylase-like metal-dependent hydrolase (beta-lactamase superfamily II)
MAELAAGHRNEVRDDAGVTGIGTTPDFAIGQRALLVPLPDGRNVMWECVTLLDDESAAAVERAGGLAAIAISHPHYYSAMVEWARRFGCPVYVHAADARWVMRPDPVVRLWEEERLELAEGVTLVRSGGHFPGGTVLHWAGGPDGGALLSGDIVQVIPDRAWVSFMYSYPNLIPLAADDVRRVAASLSGLAFERIYGAWWGRVVRSDGAAIVARSAERYVQALAGRYPA